MILAAPQRVSIHVYPQALMVGGALRLRCSVPRHADNRLLGMGVEFYRLSERPLEGEGAPVTHEMLIEHIPCDSHSAFCVVTDNLGKTYSATQPLAVGGCGSPLQGLE